MKVSLRKKKIARNRESLYLDFYHHGKRSYQFLRLYLEPGQTREEREEVRRIAERIRSRRQIELSAGNLGEVTLFRAKTCFLEYLVMRYETLGHKNYRTTLKHLKEFLGNRTRLPFSDLSTTLLEDFKEYLLQRMKPSSALAIEQCLRAATNHAVKNGILSANPFNRVDRIKVPETKKEFLTFEEIQMMASTPCNHEEVKKGFLFGCFTGIRHSDIKKLTWRDIRSESVHFTQKKTGKVEVLPLALVAKEILSQKEKSLGLVFRLPSVSWTSVVMKKWVQEAGIEKTITFHSSRHTFGTLSLTYGTDLKTVSKLLGHTSITTTEIYGKIVDSKKQKAVDSLPEIKIGV